MDIHEVRRQLRQKSIYEIPLRVTYYARVSSDSDEQLNSLGNQISYYEDLIKKHYVYNNIISLSFLAADNVETFPAEGQLAVCCHQDNQVKDIEKT